MRQKTIFMKGRKRLLGAALLLSASAFVTLGACADDGVGGYVVPDEKTVEVGFEYTPDFELGAGVEATIVKLNVPLTSKAYLIEGSFTPDVTGEYTYIVRFRQATENGVSEKEETITVKAVDTTAPTISSIADKQAEIGEYTALADDIASVVVSDNCAQNVDVYAESYVFNGVETLVEKGATSINLDKVGEYTVNLVAEDFSGNRAKSSYKVVTADTVAPVFSGHQTAIAWAKDGKVTLPKVNVIDVADCVVTATVKDSAEKPVTVTDNEFSATAGVYTVSYTATDASGNKTEKDVKLVVNERGVISNFTAGEDELWTAYGLRTDNGKLGVYDTRSNQTSIQYLEGFVVGDWTGYVSFDTSVINNRGAKLSVTPYFYVNGAWRETATQTVAPNATADIKVYLADYGIEKVDGVKLAFTCDGGVDVLIGQVKVSKTADERVVPVNHSEYNVSAQGSKEIAVGSLATGKGVVKFSIYAKTACDVLITLQYEDGSVISRHSLKAGLNEITRYPDAETGETLTNSTFLSLIISNTENYDASLYVSDFIRYANLSEIDMSAYAITEGNYSVANGETFAIPSPFTSSLRWYQDLSISIKKNTTTAVRNLAIGDLIGAGTEVSLTAGDYQIVYSFKDLTGASKEITYTLTIEPNYLTATLTMPTLFATDTDFVLPEPELTSSVYSNAELAGATVNKYYRMLGKKSWTKAVEGDPFVVKPNTTYEIRYTISCGDQYKEIYEQKFIHTDAYTLDFEPDASLTDEIAYMEENPDNPGTWNKVRQRYLYDGGIYAYRTDRSDIWLLPTEDWSKSGKQSLTVYSMVIGATTILIRPIIANDKGINAISFWMKSSQTVPDFYVNIGIGAADGDRPYVKSGWRSSETFELLAGEHFYTVYLKEPIQPFESIGAFGMVMPYAVRMYLDDVSFLHIDRMEIEDTNTYKDQRDNTNGYELTKPIVTSDVLTAEELAKVSYVLTYSLNGKDEIEVKPDANGKYILKLAEEEYGEVVFKWTVTTPNKWSSEGGVVTRTSQSGIVMIKAVRLDIEHDEIVKQGTDIKLDAPTTTAGEISNITLEYNATGTWEQMPKVEDKFALPTETNGWFQLRYTADVKVSDTLTVKGVAMSEIYVRGQYVLIDFEGSDPYQGGQAYFNSRGGGSIPGCTLEYNKETRNTVQKVLIVNDSAEGVWYADPFVFEESYNIVNVKLYANKPLTNYPVQIYAGMSASTMKWQELFINLEAGWNDVYLEYPAFKAWGSFIARMHSSFGSVQIDDIALLKIEWSKELPEVVYYGEETTLPTATLKGAQSQVSYRLKGTEEWTTVEANKFNPATLGTYEVRFTFAGISEMTKEISVELKSEELQNFVKSAKSGETITVPTLTAGTENSTAFYREKGADEWTAVANGSFVAEKVGAYEVKFYFSGINASIVKTITVIPANEFLLTDFETPFEPDSEDTYYTTIARVYTYPINGQNYGSLRSLCGQGTPTTLYEWNEDSTGNHVFHMVNAQGYDGPYWLGGGINFGFYTNTFKLKMNLSAPKSNFYFYIIYWDDNNKRHEDPITVDWANGVELGNGWYDYTVTIPNATNRVSSFEMWTCYFDIDDIRAIDTSK